MGKLRHILLVLLVVGLLVSSGCLGRDGASKASSGPIDPNWSPIYIDEAVADTLTTSQLVEKVAPTVVSIVTEWVDRDIFFQPVPKRGAGSGVLIDPHGYVVTNSHVVEGARNIKVTLSDGRTFNATKWVTDPWTDLAVVRIDPGTESLPFAHFLRNSLEKLEVLEDVVAVGNALALSGGPTWTKGVVSNLGRSIRISDDVVLHDIIQTDAAINPGNSGGPLVNLAGQVVGINTAIAAKAENIGFAISTDTAIPVVSSLIRRERVGAAWLGVSILTVTPALKAQYGLSVDSGALVVEVATGGPAAEAGLKSGDVIVGFGGVEIKTNGKLVEAIRSRDPGDTVPITFWRGSEQMQVEVTLAQRPSS
ncbi:MAG: PDZ domain-containing protein [Chloroflexi bacterium]|nr:PDZ domain-containing protein [Chloroflexota bacterium]